MRLIILVFSGIALLGCQATLPGKMQPPDDAACTQGCCSGHLGIKGIQNGHVICNDGVPSPTCACKLGGEP